MRDSRSDAFVGLTSALLAASMWVAGCTAESRAQSRGASPAAEGKAVPVVAAPPTMQTVERALDLVATVWAFERVIVRTRVTGYLKPYDLDIGDTVDKDQVIAVVDVPELEARLGQIEAARKEYKAAVRVARAAKRLKKLKASRLSRLARRNPRLVARQKVDEARLESDLAEAEIGAAQARLAALDGEEKRLNAMLQFRQIRAPFSGVVTRRFADSGALVSPNLGIAGKEGAIVEVASLDRLRVRIPVPEREARFVTAGETRVLLSIPQADIVDREVVVERVRGDIDPRSRTLTAEVLIDQPGSMMAGMLGSVRLVVESRSNAMVVPATALLVHKGDAHVFVVRAGIAYKRSVTLGIDDGKIVEIRDGITPSDLVVTRAQTSLHDKMLVRIVEDGE